MEASSQRITTVIEPGRATSFPSFRELWGHRDLVYFLARRDLVVRYKQAVAGFFWAVLQPIFLATVFAVFLGILARVPSEEGIPYPLFAISGMVLWLAFSKGVETCASSTVQNEALISKIYFPRIIIPLTALAAPLVDSVIGFFVVIVAGLIYGFVPGVTVLAAPAVILLAMATALGFGLWFSALNVKYRDFGVVIPFAMLVGLFVTPIAYPFDLVPANLQPLYALNPMVGVLEAFRWSLLGTEWPGTLILIPVVISIVTLITGARYFIRAERGFADVI